MTVTLQDVRQHSDALKVLWQLLEERPPEANISHDGHLPEWQDPAYAISGDSTPLEQQALDRCRQRREHADALPGRYLTHPMA